MSEDFIRAGYSNIDAYRLALQDLAKQLWSNGKPYSNFKEMPYVDEISVSVDKPLAETAKQEAEIGYRRLNNEQRSIVDAILRSMNLEPPSGKCLI